MQQWFSLANWNICSFCCQSFLELTLTYHHQFVKQKKLVTNSKEKVCNVNRSFHLKTWWKWNIRICCSVVQSVGGWYFCVNSGKKLVTSKWVTKITLFKDLLIFSVKHGWTPKHEFDCFQTNQEKISCLEFDTVVTVKVLQHCCSKIQSQKLKNGKETKLGH